MPELPEVETVRRGLERHLVGQTLVTVTLRRDGLRFPFPGDFASVLQGRAVLGIERRAKYLLIRLTGGRTLLGHLGMTGSFVFVDPRSHQPRRHDHVLFHLSGGAMMVYNDPRRFGVLDVLETARESEHRLLRHLGPEPLEDAWTPAVFCDTIRDKRGAIKTTILNQKVVVGVGNIYACEALFMSRISPLRPAGEVAGPDGASPPARLLVQSIKSVLATAIEAGGSTLKDFQDVEGNAGYFAHQFQVYGREGERCVRQGCGSTIVRLVQSSRSTFHCPACQP